jgi:hypothetical protein
VRVSAKPPSNSSPTSTCGKLIIPVRLASSTRPAASLERLISENATPLALSRPFTRPQNEQGSVVYTVIGTACVALSLVITS